MRANYLRYTVCIKDIFWGVWIYCRVVVQHMLPKQTKNDEINVDSVDIQWVEISEQ